MKARIMSGAGVIALRQHAAAKNRIVRRAGPA
jgi:hypothetical protein